MNSQPTKNKGNSKEESRDTQEAPRRDSVRHTDANPPVHDASVLDPTQEQVEKELAQHSEFERKTGVKEEEIDTRPVVDTKAEGSYADRTKDTQPWRDYNTEAAKKAEDEAKSTAADLDEKHKQIKKDQDRK